MIVGIVRIRLHIADCRSLKEKRSVVKGLIRRLRNKFNAAIAEIDEQDLWQKSVLAVAVIGDSTAHADSQLQAVVNFAQSQPTVVITGVETELL